MANPMLTWPDGIKRTRQRVMVWAVLERARNPLSAVEICRRAGERGVTVWLSTVYRVLELFIKQGLVVKVVVLENGMALYETNRTPHRHYAICVSCRKVIPVAACPLEQFQSQLAEKDFQITDHSLEIFGYCRDCASR
ncbi:MAG: transcriptional repressor [Planctomycetota bacterium]|jgi:Fur family ferric uptake transcriptional regulator|nr:transcriptional repressor [Planctomycetota bacterium]